MSTAARSSRDGGAAEHSGDTWRADVVFANIGLAGAAVRGRRRHTVHRPGLLQQLTEMVRQSSDVLGLALSEVGNLDDLLRDTEDEPERFTFEELIIEAFRAANIPGVPTILWPTGGRNRVGGETVTAWKEGVRIETLSPMVKMKCQDPGGELNASRSAVLQGTGRRR